MKNNWKHIFGLGLRAKAADADTDPEELAELAMDIGKHGRDAEVDEDEEPVEDRKARDRKARDRKKARDLEEDPTDEDHEPVVDRRRKAMHDALDALDAMIRKAEAKDSDESEYQEAERKLAAAKKAGASPGRIGELAAKRDDAWRKLAKDAGGAPVDDRRVKDEDLNELGDMLKEFFGQESQEPEHQAADLEEEEEPMADADPAELEELLGAGEEPDAEDAVEADPGEELEPSGEESLVEDEDPEALEAAECAHCGEATDAVNCPKCGCTDRRTKAKDRARAADGAAAVLRMLKPAIARSNDAAIKSAWNRAAGSVNRHSRATTGSYSAFAGSARARDSKRTGSAPPAVRAEEANTKLQAVYDQLHEKGGK